jgi:hypothetical protein
VGTALLLHSGNARDEGARMNSGVGEKKERWRQSCTTAGRNLCTSNMSVARPIRQLGPPILVIVSGPTRRSFSRVGVTLTQRMRFSWPPASSTASPARRDSTFYFPFFLFKCHVIQKKALVSR